MVRKYDSKRYEEFGLFIIPDKWSDGYKVIRDEDGWVFDRTYINESKAQGWIDNMIEMMDKSKAIWKSSIHN